MFLPFFLFAMIMAADKQRNPVMNMQVEPMTTGMMMLMALIGDVCSGVVVASQVQTTA